jgi:hypothetical protein
MTPVFLRQTLAGLLVIAASIGAQAESLASSASSAGSTSVGSLSDSVRGSSNSSSGTTKVAAGDYRVVAMAAVPERAGMLRLTLEPVATAERAGTVPAAGFTLDLPQQALGTHGLATGAIVTARLRPYGVEFAHGDTREAFFLALADDWHRDIDARPVSL